MNIKETKKRIIQAGHKAVEELVKVAKEAIVDSGDDITADRLKNAAATKKLSRFRDSEAARNNTTLNPSQAAQARPIRVGRRHRLRIKLAMPRFD